MELKAGTKLLLPDGRTGITLGGDVRAGHRRRCPQVKVEAPVFLGGEAELECALVGMGTFIGRRTRIRRTESIGRFTTIGESCDIGAGYMDFEGEISTSYPARETSIGWYKDFFAVARTCTARPAVRSRTLVGSDVFVGDGAVVCQGVHLGDGAVVAPGAVVLSDVPPYGVVTGSPARLCGRRFEEAEVRRLLALRWWRYGAELLERGDLGQAADRLLEELEQKATGCRERRTMEEGITLRYSQGRFLAHSQSEGEQKLLFQLPDR